MTIRRIFLPGALLLAAACGGHDARVAGRAPADAPAASAATGAPTRDVQFPDSAPSVEAVPGTDQGNPEFDSLKSIARRTGVAESMIPGELPEWQRTEGGGAGVATAVPAAATASLSAAAARVPLVTGLRIVSTLVFPDGDRDNVVTTTVDDGGVTYSWHLRQQANGKVQEYDLKRFVRANDLAGAPRLNDVVSTEGPEETPGYTFVSLSQATYRRLRDEGEAAYTVTGMENGLLGGGLGALGAGRVTYKGSFSVASKSPEGIPVLLDGRRTTLPALHLKGRFAFQDSRQDGDYWVLADSLHPLILKEANGTNVLQVIRIDRPAMPGEVESELAKDCRAELPGIYFAFGSAELDPASAPALASLAALLKRHADWTLAIEGHTDNVGGAAANQKLSEQRAEAVRTALATRQGVAASRLSAAGFGSTRPREPNTTVEGRARNRRVEVVRPCGGKG